MEKIKRWLQKNIRDRKSMEEMIKDARFNFLVFSIMGMIIHAYVSIQLVFLDFPFAMIVPLLSFMQFANLTFILAILSYSYWRYLIMKERLDQFVLEVKEETQHEDQK